MAYLCQNVGMTITAQQGTRVPRVDIHLGMRMAAARNEAGVTQERMAQMLGCNRRTIVRWESGSHSVPPAVLISYSVATDVNLGWLQSGVFGEFTPDWNYMVRPEGFEPPAY